MKTSSIVIVLAIASLFLCASALPSAGQGTLADRLKSATEKEKADKEKKKPAAGAAAKTAGSAATPASASKFQNRGVGTTATKLPDPAKVGKKAGGNASKVIRTDGARGNPVTQKEPTYGVSLTAKSLNVTREGDTLHAKGRIGTSAGAKLECEPVQGSWSIYSGSPGLLAWNSTPIAKGQITLNSGAEENVTAPPVAGTSAMRFKLVVESNGKSDVKEFQGRAAKFVVRYRCPEWKQYGETYSGDSDTPVGRRDVRRAEAKLKALGFGTRVIHNTTHGVFDDSHEYTVQFRSEGWQEGIYDTAEGAEGFRKSLPPGCETEVVLR